MSHSGSRLATGEMPANQHQLQRIENRSAFATALADYALAGAAGSFLVTLIEWVDLNILLRPVFESFGERLTLTAYFSLNILGGLVIGLIAGLVASASASLNRIIERLVAKGRVPASGQRILAGVAVSALASLFLNQQDQVHRYIIGLIREAEKIPVLNQPLLNHERSTSYLILIAAFIGCGLIARGARHSRLMSPLLRATWMLGLLLAAAAAYYVDSRVEVQLYEHSLHRTMFLLDLTFSMALAGTICSSFRGIHLVREGRRGKVVIGIATLATSALVVFTFIRFDSNQNLKTQLFYRTTQAKQYFQLFQWALDFDRDGYSAYLGGGDLDDSRPDINPSMPEIIGDGVDNNCIGGDLTKQDLDEWNRERSSRHALPYASARRFNVIYIFVDALRADHLSTYGYHRKTSPNIDRLAARSSVFENAYTPAPNTFEALPKFMQSSYWDAHLDTWPEILSRNGYRTVLFPRRTATLLRHVRGMTVLQDPPIKTFQDTIDKAIEIIGKTPADHPFGVFLYSTDPHRPYLKHDEFYYGSSDADLYDGEVSYADFHLGRLFEWLERAGKLNDTMIVLMADHGESLGERSVFKHSTQLYNEQARVPIIIHVPGLAPRRIADYVSTVDLGATILNSVGLDYPQEYFGVSLVPLMRGEPYVHPPVYAEQTNEEVSPYVQPRQNVHPESKKYMVITQDGYKLIYNRNHYSFELFDLKSDAREERNLYDRLPEKASELKRLLGRYVDVVTVSRPPDADESQYHFTGGPVSEDQ